MTPEQFIYWIKGYLTAQIDSREKQDIEKALKEVTSIGPTISNPISNANHTGGTTNFTFTTGKTLLKTEPLSY